ncbi:MAG: hypothetical protein ACLQIB_37545 [Isosphaeraceae bacterium]
MNAAFKRCGRFSISMFSLLGFVLTMGSASLLSGCGDDKSQMQMVEQKEAPAEIAKGSMDFYKNSHLKGGAARKK